MARSEQPIVIDGAVTRADLDAALRWHTRALLRRAALPTVERLLVLVVMLVMLLGIPFAIVAIEGEGCAAIALSAGAFGYLAGIGIAIYSNRRISQRVRALNTAGLGHHAFTFAPEGLSVKNPSAVSSHTPWTALKRMDVTPRHLAYWHDDYLAQMIPRALIGADRESELLAAIRRWAPHLAMPGVGAAKPN